MFGPAAVIGRAIEFLELPLARRLLLFVGAAGFALAIDWTRIGAVAAALQSLGLGKTAGNAIAAALIGGAVLLHFRLLGRFAFRTRVLVVWIELIGLFLLFFYSFNLNYGFILSRLPILLGFELENGFLQGAALTLFICILSILLSTLLALAAALARLSENGPAFGLATFYISFFRGTPLLLQVLLIYLGLPQVGVVMDAIPAGILALSLNYGAYMAEIFRAGILSIPKAQSEAALSLGLKRAQVMWLVVLPQAIRVIIPPTGNQFIAMLKESSLVSVMGVWELMYLARSHGRAEFRYMEMLITAAVIYWGLSAVFELVQARIERRLGKGVRAP